MNAIGLGYSEVTREVVIAGVVDDEMIIRVTRCVDVIERDPGGGDLV